MATMNLRVTLDEDAPAYEYLEDGIIDAIYPLDDGVWVIIKGVDDTLIESLNPDDLCEFFGIDSEFVIATELF